MALSWGKSSHRQLCLGEAPPVGGQAQGAEGLGGHGNSPGGGQRCPPRTQGLTMKCGASPKKDFNDIDEETLE